MPPETPPQTPWGKAIEDAAKATGRSVRALAANARMSDTRWRQIVKGWQPTPTGVNIAVHGTAWTVARMAWAAKLDSVTLITAGRPDAAAILDDLNTRHPNNWQPLPDTRKSPRPTTTSGADEIDLICNSAMTPTEKLHHIRQVLELRAEAATRDGLADARMTAVDDLLAFVRAQLDARMAQLDEDERVAREAPGPTWLRATERAGEPGKWRGVSAQLVTLPPDRPHPLLVGAEVARSDGYWVAEHIARWDPARVLDEVRIGRAEVEAKRRILDAWEPGYAGHNDGIADAIYAIAQPYAGQPGWREEWAT